MQEAKERVLVTGISGYIAAEAAYQLLERGYKVRGTVRSVKNELKLAPIKALHPSAQHNLEFVEANLNSQDGWVEAMEGVDYVLHIASPYVLKAKKESDLIDPAINGTMYVMKAASTSNIKGLVLTSSCVAIYPHKFDQLEHIYTEKDWGDLKETNAYGKSKILAEQKAWEFWNSLDKDTRFKFAVINPSAVFGPQRIPSKFTSSDLMIMFMNGTYPSIPRVTLPLVLVSDVAKAHIVAMENFDKSNGNRYICNENTYWMTQIFKMLSELREYGYKVPKSQMKYCLFSMAGLFKEEVKILKPQWGRRIHCAHDKIVQQLGFEFTPVEKGVLNMAYECIKLGLIKDKTKGKAAERNNFEF